MTSSSPASVTALTYQTSSRTRLLFYLKHHAPPVSTDPLGKLELTRSHSTYGFRPDEYDPHWQMGREILQAYLRDFALDADFIQQHPLPAQHPLRPCLQALAQLKPVDVEALKAEDCHDTQVLRNVLRGPPNYPWQAVPPCSRLALLLRPFQNFMVSTTQQTYDNMNPNLMRVMEQDEWTELASNAADSVAST